VERVHAKPLVLWRQIVAIMFKADGTPIKNPTNYVAGIERRGYNDPLFDKHGKKIQNPVAFLRKIDSGDEVPLKASVSSKRKSSSSTNSSESPVKRQRGEGIFKADGTPVRNPVSYVEGIQKRGYRDPLFGSDGKEIRNPVAYVDAMVRRGHANPPAGAANAAPAAIWLAAAATGATLFKADGTPVRNTVAYVAGIEDRGYTDPLFDAKGQEIRNPVAYVAAMERRGDTSASQALVPHVAAPSTSGSSSAVLFKENGTPVRDPVAYVEGIKKRGYRDPLYGTDGRLIRDPVRYVESMLERTSEVEERTQNENGKGGRVRKKAGVRLFKEDGTEIRKPEAYIAGIEKRGYKDPIFDATGYKILDPVEYLRKHGVTHETPEVWL